jgi:hypothetical protein
MNSALPIDPGYRVLSKYKLGFENSCPVYMLLGNNILPMCLNELLLLNDSEELIPDPIKRFVEKLRVDDGKDSVEAIALKDISANELAMGVSKASELAIEELISKYERALNTFNSVSVGMLSEDTMLAG